MKVSVVVEDVHSIWHRVIGCCIGCVVVVVQQLLIEEQYDEILYVTMATGECQKYGHWFAVWCFKLM
jgi:hypothetical protein